MGTPDDRPPKSTPSPATRHARVRYKKMKKIKNDIEIYVSEGKCRNVNLLCGSYIIKKGKHNTRGVRVTFMPVHQSANFCLVSTFFSMEVSYYTWYNKRLGN